jgi:hypothetical protein
VVVSLVMFEPREKESSISIHRSDFCVAALSLNCGRQWCFSAAETRSPLSAVRGGSPSGRANRRLVAAFSKGNSILLLLQQCRFSRRALSSSEKRIQVLSGALVQEENANLTTSSYVIMLHRSDVLLALLALLLAPLGM